MYPATARGAATIRALILAVLRATYAATWNSEIGHPDTGVAHPAGAAIIDVTAIEPVAGDPCLSLLLLP